MAIGIKNFCKFSGMVAYSLNWDIHLKLTIFVCYHDHRLLARGGNSVMDFLRILPFFRFFEILVKVKFWLIFLKYCLETYTTFWHVPSRPQLFFIKVVWIEQLTFYCQSGRIVDTALEIADLKIININVEVELSSFKTFQDKKAGMYKCYSWSQKKTLMLP